MNAWTQRRFIAGPLTNEPDTLIRWIMAPRSVEPVTAMPDMGVDEATARAMAASLYAIEE